MGYNDFFEYERKHHKNNRDHHERNDRYFGHDENYGKSHEQSQHYDFKKELIGKYLKDPKFRRLAIFAVIAILAIVVVIIMLFFPLLLKLFDFIAANGIQGVIDSVWNGSK